MKDILSTLAPHRIRKRGNRIVAVDLQDLQLKCLPPDLTLIKYTEELLLSNNLLTEIPAQLSTLKYLKFIDLANNAIKDISNIESILQVQQINLANNPIPARLLENFHSIFIREKYVLEYINDLHNLYQPRVDLVDLVSNLFAQFTKQHPWPFSYSQLSTLKKCRTKHFLDYILNFRKFELSEPSDLLILGKDFHEIIEYNLVTKQVYPTKIEIPSDEYQTELNYIVQLVNNWYKSGYQQNIYKIELEKYIESPPEQLFIDSSTIWIKRIGYIDMLWELEDGSFFIWDFKTSKSDNGKYRHLRQVLFYKQMLEAQGKQVDGVGIIYPFLHKTVIRMNRYVPRNVPDTLRIRSSSPILLEQEIQQFFKKLLTEPPSSNYSYYTCQYCEYGDYMWASCRDNQINYLHLLQRISSKEQLIDLLSTI